MKAHGCKAVVVVGAGPAGLMAAVSAAQAGARVVVLEQMSRPGLKLLASGGGRCNLTNTLPAADFPAHFGSRGRFVEPALAACGPDRLRAILAAWGVRTQSPDGFHVYPVTESARTVLEALLGELRRLGVEVRTGCALTGLSQSAEGRHELRMAAGAMLADAVIVAAGGCSYPDLGGTGGGYALAQAAGHELVAPKPALVPLVVREPWPGTLAGLSLRQATVELDLPGRRRVGVTGDLLFTHRGLSGPAILDLSGAVAEELARRPEAPLRLDVWPPEPAASAFTGRDASARRLMAWLTLGRSQQGAKSITRLLAEAGVPQTLARCLAQQAGLAAARTAAQLTTAERQALVGCLTACPLTVTATEGFSRAMVTRGGVALREVDPATLASRKLAGLFFAGEVLDLDGPCGGFNLQWAFASGWLAGAQAAKRS